MTDSRDRPAPPRVDLRALDAAPDPAQADRVVGAVLAKLPPRPAATPGVWDDLAAWLRPGLAAAAVVAVLAGGVLAGGVLAGGGLARQPHAATAPSLEERVAAWAGADPAPSAGELLVVLQGYGQ